MNSILILTEEHNVKCQYPDCNEPATAIADDSEKRQVGFYCDAHAEKVADYNSPEYHVSCPNCGCYFGVN